MATVKALAGKVPAQREEPLSRYSPAELARLVGARPDAPALSQSTIWRILDRAVRKPWPYERWHFPRDALLAPKAGPGLDLYEGYWERRPLQPDDCVLSTDE